MRKQLKVILPSMIMMLLISCGEINKKVEEKLNELSNKANNLDSLVNKEMDKVMGLDSIIYLEGNKLKVLDSLINKSSLRIDSIVKEKIKPFK